MGRKNWRKELKQQEMSGAGKQNGTKPRRDYGNGNVPGTSSSAAVNFKWDEFTPVATKVIPLLLDSGYLPKKSILTCRRLNKKVKTILDKELVGARKPSWLANAFTLKNRASILKFMGKAEGMTSSGGTLTSLFAWLLNLTSGTDEPKTLELLQKYGSLLLNVRLAITLDQDRPMPFGTKANLISALRYLPNIVSLSLAIEQIAIDYYEMYWSDMEEESSSTATASFSLAHFTQFPDLNELTELTLEVLPAPHGYEDYFVVPPVQFFHPFFKAYGPWLTKLTCHQFLLGDDEESCKKLFNLYLKTILDLTITGIDVDGGEEAFRTLEKVNLSRLKRLALFSGDDEIFLDESDECIFGDNDKDVLQLLGRFRDTLLELRLYKLYAKGLNILERNLKVLTNVKGLTLSAGNLNSDVWFSFRTQFPYLEWIRFEPSSEIELLATSTKSGHRNWTRAPPPFPNAEVRKRFFSIFPKLRSIIWVLKQGGKAKRNGRAPKTIVFNRHGRFVYDVCCVQ